MIRLFLLFSWLVASIPAFSQNSITIVPATNDLNRYTLFLKGEFHEHKQANERSFLLLAQYLYTHNNVRYLVFEWGPDFSFLANRYLQTQNDSLLLENTLSFSRAFWDTLVLHNQHKPDADKIEIAGFDFNRSVFTARAFRELLKQKSAFADSSIRSAIEAIIKWDGTKWTWEQQRIFVGQMNNLRRLCTSKKVELAAYFGNDSSSFFSIVNHQVESTPQVKRDKESIVYVKKFLQEKRSGNVLFNLGVNHTFFDHAGMGNLLQRDSKFQNTVCSIYPYHLTSITDKPKFQQELDGNLYSLLPTELQTASPFSLINLAQKGIYPKGYKKAQWVYVIPEIK